MYGNESEKHPGALFSEIHPVFNRAVIFDVSLNSWHGLPSPIKFPAGVTRNSLAVYYLCKPDNFANHSRLKARFAPSSEQVGDVEVLKLIEARSALKFADTVYEQFNESSK